MSRFTLSQMAKLRRLSDVIMPSYREFFPERLITDVGLYEAIIIDTADVQVFDIEIAGKPPRIEVSRDVEALHKFINFEERIMLPCPGCLQSQPFDLKKYFNPKKVVVASGKPSTLPKRVHLHYSQTEESTHHNVFEPPAIPHYRVSSNYLRDFDQTQFVDVDFQDYMYRCSLACVDGIVENLGEIRRDFICTYDVQHRGFVDYIIYETVDRYTLPSILQEYEKRKAADPNTSMTKDEKKISELYERLKTCLIMEKVGQSPSMADLQMFDIEKYKTVLSKEHFRNFRMALGLHASGVGCGSFVYLRRIFEGLVTETEQAISKQNGWSQEEYDKKRFNEKIDYLESLGQKIIPDVLEQIRTKIYGVLSLGVHASSDQECNELFPAMKFVIEELLDHKLAEKAREEKLKQITATLGNIK